MTQDYIDIEFLPDGTVRITTPGISASNHRAADEAIKMIQGLLGGNVVVTRNKTARTRAHQGHGLRQ